MTVSIIATLVTFIAPARATAAFSGGGGYDYCAGPGGQRTRSAMAIVGAEAEGTSASLALMRYADDQTGPGTGYVLAVGIPLAAGSEWRAWGSRFVGDESLRSWRIKAGPLVEFTRGSTAGLYYTHAQDNAGLRSDGAAAELTTPLGTRFTGRAGAAYATAPGGLHATQGTVGLGFAPLHGVELSAEAGVARNAAFLTSPGPSRGLPLSLLGEPGGGRSEPSARVEPVVLLGVRVLLP